MKPSPRARKQRKKGPPQVRQQPQTAAPAGWPPWLVPGLCLVLAAGTTFGLVSYFGILDHVLGGQLPPQLVGKWVVRDGDPTGQAGATFDFFPNGTMEGRINVGGKEGVIKARVKVEGETLHITTQNPNTKQDETRRQTIKKLTEAELILEDEKGNLFKMRKAN